MSNQAFSVSRGPIPLEAAVDLDAASATPAQYRFVKLNSSGKVVRCSVEGEDAIGVLMNDPKAGEGCSVAFHGDVQRVVCSEAIDYAESIMTDDEGRATVVTGSNAVLGVALTSTATAGDHATVALRSLGDANYTALLALLTPGFVDVTEGAEGAVTANTIELACELQDENGDAIAEAREVVVRSISETADKGDLAAADTPVGTLNEAFNPSTGQNVAWFTTTAAGLFSVAVTNDQAEDTLVEIIADGCRPKLIKLTFA